jgi:hypothetical protein
MADGFGVDLTDILKSITKSENIIMLAEKGLTRIERAVQNIEEAWDKINKIYSNTAGGVYLEQAVYELYLSVKDTASKILSKHAARALRSSEEFKISMYSSRLLEACDDKDSLVITLTGVGASAKLTIMENLDATAGDIEQWAQAVESTRENLGEEFYSKKDPKKASLYWRNVVYGTPQYTTTIEDRLNSCDAKAPFWSILDKGNRGISMSSDWGGTPYPSKSGTDFVAKAIAEISEDFLEDKNSIIETNRVYLEKLSMIMDTITRQFGRAKEFAEEVETGVGNEVDNIEPPPRTDVISKIEEHYGGVLEWTDKNKLLTIIEELSTMGTVVSYRTSKDGRVTVTLRGSGGKKARVSVGVIQRFLAGD